MTMPKPDAGPPANDNVTGDEQRRLTVFFDGTWNDPRDRTNVHRLRSLMADTSEDGARQWSKYIRGVGTDVRDFFSGGIGGNGLSETIQEGYAWLAEHYRTAEGDGTADEIFVFGFSRGAYAARSLVGLIGRYGLPDTGDPAAVTAVYVRYREGVPIPAEVRRRLRPVDVRFLGVWDTVGSLGLPTKLLKIERVTRNYFQFHDTQPSDRCQEACHALAVDEHRTDFDVTLWTMPVDPDPATGGPPADAARIAAERWPNIEQRWFVGAHSDVGGSNDLAKLPLRWIQGRAGAAGLAFTQDVVLTGDEHIVQPVSDSYDEAFFGLYKYIRFLGRRQRAIGRAPQRDNEDGETRFLQPIRETIDPSVIARWRALNAAGGKYRPKNLRTLVERDVHAAALETTDEPYEILA